MNARFLFFSVAIAALLLSFSGIAEAAGPVLSISWHSPAYVPAGYSGKAMPVSGSSVTLSLDGVSDSGLINLAPYDITWYVNDVYFQDARGLIRITLPIKDTQAGSSVRVRAEIRDYPDGPLNRVISVPIVSPLAVIVAPYPSLLFSLTSLKLKVLPYFWNVSDESQLNFAWTLNGDPIKDHTNPSDLTININANAGAGAGLAIGLRTQNPLRSAETAFSAVFMTYQP